MQSEFRFFLVCMHASKRIEDELVTLTGVVNKLETKANEPVDLTVALGLVLRPPMKGAHLDLMVWKLGKNGEPLRFGDYVGTPLILPQGLGPVVLPHSITLRIPESGIYGFYLFDREGIFGPKEALLATYMFSVLVIG